MSIENNKSGFKKTVASQAGDRRRRDHIFDLDTEKSLCGQTGWQVIGPPNKTLLKTPEAALKALLRGTRYCRVCDDILTEYVNRGSQKNNGK